MATTLTTGSEKQRKQLRTQKQSDGRWETTEWGSWKGEEWTREHRTTERAWNTKTEADQARQKLTAELLENGWRLSN